jgi:hypothetical protein
MERPDDAETRPGRWRTLLAWGLLLLALHQARVFMTLTLHGRERELWFLFSSDTVQYGLLFRDLFQYGFSYSGWNISHAPEYVQMAWSLLLFALTPSFAAGHVLEALAQPLLLALSLHAVLRRVTDAGSVLAPVAVALMLAMVTRGISLDFIAFIWSNRHGFTVILSALALGFALRPAPRAGGLSLALVVAAAVASDMLSLPWLVAPLLATLLLQAVRPGEAGIRPWALRNAAAVAAGVAVGLAVFRLATPVITVGEKIEIDLSRVSGSLARVAEDVAVGGRTQNLMNALLLGGLVVSVTAAWRARRVEARMLGLFATILPLATLAAVVSTATPFREPGYTRYFLAPQFAALVAVSLGLAHVLGRFGQPALTALVFAFLLRGFSTIPAGVTPVERYYPPYVRCIDDAARRHGLRYGVADYWVSKVTTALSAVDLRVVSVTARLDPFTQFSNVEWFLGGVGARRHDRPVYTFAILGTTLPHEPGIAPHALAALGEPVAVEECHGLQVVVLPRGASERLREQFARHPHVREYYARRELPLPAAR